MPPLSPSEPNGIKPSQRPAVLLTTTPDNFTYLADRLTALDYSTVEARSGIPLVLESLSKPFKCCIKVSMKLGA